MGYEAGRLTRTKPKDEEYREVREETGTKTVPSYFLPSYPTDGDSKFSYSIVQFRGSDYAVSTDRLQPSQKHPGKWFLSGKK